MDICEVIKEAKCCSAKIGHKYARELSFGNETDELKYNLLTINAYIRTLERNRGEKKKYVKKVPYDGQEISFSMLKRKNNLLILEASDKLVCVTEEIEPCLSDSDIESLIEKIKSLCSTCNCNC